MKVNKRLLGQLEKAYATAIMKINGEKNFLVATEGQGPCLAYNEANWLGAPVWEGPGGTMNIVPIPGRENEFIATQNFFPTFQAKESCLVYAKCDANAHWTISPIMTIPYLHRFDIFSLNGQLVFIGATLCEDKTEKEDWSKPGKVYVGEIAEDIAKPFSLTTIIDGITKNHGFCRAKWNGRDAYLISGVEGVFAAYVAEVWGQDWTVERILNGEVSDMAVCDIDGDGVMELATIEPFHGSRGVIYKVSDNGLVPIHEYEYEFGHVVWGGMIRNKPSFIIGGRKGNRELNCFQTDGNSGRITHFTIDNTGGPSNIAVINTETADLILAANREIGEVALYEITV